MAEEQEQKIATYTVLPATSQEIAASVETAQKLLRVLDNWTLTTPEDEEKAANLLKGAHQRWKELDALRKKVVKPAVDAQRTINDHFRPALTAWAEAKTKTKKLMAEAVAVREATNQAAIEAASQGSVAALTQVKEIAPPAGVSYQEEVKIVIEDEDKIPREYLAIDWSALKILARKGKPAPPGVRFERQPRVAVTGRS